MGGQGRQKTREAKDLLSRVQEISAILGWWYIEL